MVSKEKRGVWLLALIAAKPLRACAGEERQREQGETYVCFEQESSRVKYFCLRVFFYLFILYVFLCVCVSVSRPQPLGRHRVRECVCRCWLVRLRLPVVSREGGGRVRFLTRLASADVSSIQRYNIFFVCGFSRGSQGRLVWALWRFALYRRHASVRVCLCFYWIFCVRISLCVGNTIALWRSVLKSNQSCRR